MKYLIYFFLCYSACNILRTYVCTLQCVDESGNSVDWYVLYKLPRLKNHPNVKIAKGVAYAFITSKSVKEGWKLSNVSISNPNSIPARTLSFLFVSRNHEKVTENFHIFYNDQPPFTPVVLNNGHSKGIVAGNSDGGFWIVHSVPKFPVTNGSNYEYPKSGKLYGQSFLCISMNRTTLDAVGNQLTTNCVHVFKNSFPLKLKDEYPSLVNATKEQCGTSKTSKEVLYSVGNIPFLSFAKSAKFGADLYSDWLSEILHSELLVETWLHQDELPSVCSKPYRVLNIKVISFKIAGCEFKNYYDHSKYAISMKTNGSCWVCIGDINRQRSQFHRGGGTVCLQDEDLWTAYYRMIAVVEQCPKNFK